MKTIEQFFAEAKDNKALQQAFEEAMKNGTADAFLKEQQVDAILEELEAYSKAKSGELADDELEAVAGGELSWGSIGTVPRAEDVQYEFNVGDRVEVYFCWFFHTFTNRATVIDRKLKPSTAGYRPIYLIQFDEPGIDGEPVQLWKNQDDLSY